MEAGSLTSVLIYFANIFTESVRNIIPHALTLFGILILIDCAWMLSMVLLNNQPLVSSAIKKVVKYGIFYWLIQNYANVVSGLLNTFMTIGLTAVGNVVEPSLITDPSYIIDMGFATWHPILESVGLVNILGSHRPLMALITYIFAIIGYFIIAMQIFITYLEFYVIAGLAVYFLPFGCLDRTVFMAEKAISAIIAVSVRVLVVSFVMSASLPSLLELQASSSGWIEGANHTQAMKYMFTILAVAFLSWTAPSMAAGLFSGTPSLSGNQAISAGMMMSSMIVSSISGGFATLRSTLAGAGAGAASNLGGALSGFASGSGGTGSAKGGVASDLANTARLANLATAGGGFGGDSFSTAGGGAEEVVKASELSADTIAAGIRDGSSGNKGASLENGTQIVTASDLSADTISGGVNSDSKQQGYRG